MNYRHKLNLRSKPLRICLRFAVIFIWLLGIISCEKEEEKDILAVSKNVIELPAEGGTSAFTLTTDAASWQIEYTASDWLTIPFTQGSRSEALISLTVESRSLLARTDTLLITAGTAVPVYVAVQQAASEYLYSLSTNRVYFNFEWSASTATIELSSDSPAWKLSSDVDWIEFSLDYGAAGNFSVETSVSSNPLTEERAGTILLSGEGAPRIEIPVSQKGCYPSYNSNPLPPDASGMASNAITLAQQMQIGWNIGNTLEAIGGETAWGNPKVTEELIQLVKNSGFDAIRIPCSWNQYANQQTAEIDADWLNRVKQVVQYGVENEMYVILNIHWDGGWLENNCTPAKQEENRAKQKAFWEQIATHLRHFDEHLLFAGSNEPHVENATQMDVLLSYHQTFIDAVRSTGGRNTYRTLVVQGPATDIEKTEDLMHTMPTDVTEDRLMAEVHFYSPYNFCLMTEDASWGNMAFYWGSAYHSDTNPERNATWGEEAFIDDMFARMKTKFVEQQIPVILGEFGVIKRTYLSGDELDLHLSSRAYYYQYLSQKAKENGIIPFYWDAGNLGEHEMSLFNRSTNTVHDQQAIDALMGGLGK